MSQKTNGSSNLELILGLFLNGFHEPDNSSCKYCRKLVVWLVVLDRFSLRL